MDDGTALSVTKGMLPDSDHARLLKAATYASVATAAVLICVKAVAWMLTDSVSVLSTLIDSLLDIIASLINLFAVRQALQPADAEHRFGHGKAEPIAGLGQAAFILGSGMFLLFEVAARLFNPEPVSNGLVGISVMVFSIAATIALVQFQRYVVRRTGSVAISADSLHYVSDVLINGSVILALVLYAALGWRLIDPLCGAAIAIYIMYTAWTIAALSLNLLMDRELSDEARERILRIVTAHPGVTAAHDLRTRSSGTQTFIQLHLEMDGAMSLMRAHQISDEVEASIQEAFPNAEVIIHEDPDNVPESRARFS
jgi:ferrous-iron efflux pump FieF